MDTAVTVFSSFNAPPAQFSLPNNVATSSLLLASTLAPGSDAVIPFIIPFFSSISLIPSWQWFFALTPFEAIFLGFIVVQIFILNAIGVLPIELNQWFRKQPSGRKKRDVASESELNARRTVASTLTNILKRVDRESCFLRALCLIQMREMTDPYCGLHKDVKTILRSLRTLQKRRDILEDSDNDDFNLFLPFEEAVQVGLNSATQFHGGSKNSTNLCEERYSLCPASSQEIYGYFDHINEHYFQLK